MAIINQVVSGGGGSAPATKYGINIDGWIGDILAGVPRTDQAVGTLNMPTLTSISGWAEKFKRSSGLVGIQNLSGVTNIDERGAHTTFSQTGITGLNLSSLVDINAEGMANVCYLTSTLVSVDLSSVNLIDSAGLYSAFEGTGLTTLSIPVRVMACSKWDGNFNHFYKMCSNCSSLQTLSFPNLTPSSFTDILTYYEESFGEPPELYWGINDCMGSMVNGCSGVTVHFTQSLGSQLSDEGHSVSELQQLFGGTNTTVLFDLTDPV